MVQNRRNEPKSLLDMVVIIKYIVLSIVFSLAIFGLREVVMYALSLSPTKQVGNGILTLYEIHNTGAAFNLFAGQTEMIITASFIALAIIAFAVLILSTKLTQTAISGMSLLSSGILMNMIERLSHGYVIDYIYCNFAPTFPMFNIADVMIVFGALGIVMSLFSKNRS